MGKVCTVVEVDPGIFSVCSAFVGIFKNLVLKIMACGSERVNLLGRCCEIRWLILHRTPGSFTG